jgi:hypothetical protein
MRIAVLDRCTASRTFDLETIIRPWTRLESNNTLFGRILAGFLDVHDWLSATDVLEGCVSHNHLALLHWYSRGDAGASLNDMIKMQRILCRTDP